ncbi:MAG TPA: hypothetical protein VF183_07970 [Acidimicrobiales bacterium]
MKCARIASAVAGGLLAVGSSAIGAVSANADTPPTTGCPAGYELLSVDWLTQQGAYMLPGQLDSAGNDDGFVCGKPLNPVVQYTICADNCPVPIIYNFYDNNRTPAFKS